MVVCGCKVFLVGKQKLKFGSETSSEDSKYSLHLECVQLRTFDLIKLFFFCASKCLIKKYYYSRSVNKLFDKLVQLYFT